VSCEHTFLPFLTFHTVHIVAIDNMGGSGSGGTRQKAGRKSKVAALSPCAMDTVLKRQVSDKTFRAYKATAMVESSTSVVLSRVNQILF
jgi:hypothetical protein